MTPQSALEEPGRLHRAEWVDVLWKIASPVMQAAAEARLISDIPRKGPEPRQFFSPLEAFGRSLAGIAPWLNLQTLQGAEGKAREEMAEWARQGLNHLTRPGGPGYFDLDLTPENQRQPLVDTAFLAHGLLRGWETLWEPLPEEVKSNIIKFLIQSRRFRTGRNNWILFSTIIEIALQRAGADWDRMRVEYGVRQFLQWYKGDSMYGDGANFHWDYYNSFVIQPMLYDTITAPGEPEAVYAPIRPDIENRLIRFATILERMISPEGTYPPIGRSLTYRFGAFQALAQVALIERLPEKLPPPAVRCALTAVMRRTLAHKSVFDEDGWLEIGLAGHQPGLGERYITTGSLYLCLTVFLPLGLPPENPFWSSPSTPWTSLRVWNGEDLPADKSLTEDPLF